MNVEHLISAFFPTPKRIYVEGNIGAGKTTAIGEIKRRLETIGKRVCAFPEQTERWQHQGLLKGLYDGDVSGKRAFDVLGPLQDFVMREKYTIQYRNDYDVFIFERHPNTTLNVFGAMEDASVREMFYTVDSIFPFLREPDLTLYIDVSPEECISRVKKRGRREEESITLSYLQDLHERHKVELRARRTRDLNVVSLRGDEKMVDNAIREIKKNFFF
jgi:thymidylate kinase